MQCSAEFGRRFELMLQSRAALVEVFVENCEPLKQGLSPARWRFRVGCFVKDLNEVAHFIQAETQWFECLQDSEAFLFSVPGEAKPAWAAGGWDNKSDLFVVADCAHAQSYSFSEHADLYEFWIVWRVRHDQCPELKWPLSRARIVVLYSFTPMTSTFLLRFSYL